MKTGVSIPDAVFEKAELLADRLGVSRSQLYAQALKAFMAAHEHEEITRRLDAIYAGEASRPDSVMSILQAIAIKRHSPARGVW
ncbi:MAG: hypothetical protein ACT4P5_22380 [Armatimonadota bacterium]